MNQGASRRGLNLIEIIIGMSIVAVVFYALIAVFVNLAPRTAQVETFNKKVYLAQEKMEEFLARGFTREASVAPNSFPAPFGDYKYQILVTYVTSTDVNTAAGTAETSFKNVKVRVWGGQINAASTVEIVSLVTSYEVR
jgi:Tfp pilus assembly protein PilV